MPGDRLSVAILDECRRARNETVAGDPAAVTGRSAHAPNARGKLLSWETVAPCLGARSVLSVQRNWGSWMAHMTRGMPLLVRTFSLGTFWFRAVPRDILFRRDIEHGARLSCQSLDVYLVSQCPRLLNVPPPGFVDQSCRCQH